MRIAGVQIVGMIGTTHCGDTCMYLVKTHRDTAEVWVNYSLNAVLCLECADVDSDGSVIQCQHSSTVAALTMRGYDSYTVNAGQFVDYINKLDSTYNGNQPEFGYSRMTIEGM